MFLILFITTGIGNGSTYRMIPSIFREEKLAKAAGLGDAGRRCALKAASHRERRRARIYRRDRRLRRISDPDAASAQSIAATGGPQFALAIFLAST